MRTAKVSRTTKETSVTVEVNLDGVGTANLALDIPFLKHMLQSFATHSNVDLTLDARGDLEHHITEDVGLVLGAAIREALGESQDYARFGSACIPMDDSLAIAAIDMSNRPFCVTNFDEVGDDVDGMKVEDLTHFLESLSTSMRCTLHVQIQYGRNAHHMIEACFKALALSFKQAIRRASEMKVPSSKGVL